MKVLVTGGYGLIGHNIVRRLLDRGDDVSIVDTKTNYGIIPQSEIDYLMAERAIKINNHPCYSADIANNQTNAVDYVIKTRQPEVIVHCASFPRQKVVNANPALGADVMMRGLINLLESAKNHGVKRFVYLSSSMVYGDFENYVTEDAVCRPQGQYGIMKLAGEWLVKDYSRKYGFEYVIIRPSAVYGPLDVEDRVVSKFMLTAMRGGVLKVNGAGETLDFTYVDDAADGIVSAVTTPGAANHTFNITKSHSTSLLQAAEMIVKLVGTGSIDVRDKDADFPSRGALDITQARNILGFDPKVDVYEGFVAYYDWLTNSHYWSPYLTRA